ncbi:MAG: DUF983 domain-containing protein [Acidobacteria bacterium]|nr:DUF983 domain-containing protein [Acidobacteriota bacterium]
MTRGRFAAIARKLCPRCREGRIFAGFLRMNRKCPACGLVFEREQGYFVAAMYVSYALSVPLLAVLAVAVRLAKPGWSVDAVLGTAALLAIPFVPALFRYSRVLWMHLDREIDRET